MVYAHDVDVRPVILDIYSSLDLGDEHDRSQGAHGRAMHVDDSFCSANHVTNEYHENDVVNDDDHQLIHENMEHRKFHGHHAQRGADVVDLIRKIGNHRVLYCLSDRVYILRCIFQF